MQKFIFSGLVFLILSASLQTLGENSANSVLATGKWYKLTVLKQGIYKVTYEQLDSAGIHPSGIVSSRIRLFGNGSGMLPEMNATPRTDDLREVAIQVYDGGDGYFGQGDYFLFYGESADKYIYERLTRFFSHQRNIYSDTSYYYLNMDQSDGKRISIYPYQGINSNYRSTSYDFYFSHESDQYNLIRSGKEWVGEQFDNSRNTLVFPVIVPDIDASQPVRIKTSVVGKCPVTSYFVIEQDGERVDSLKIDTTDPKDYSLAGRSKVKLSTLPAHTSDQTFSITYNLPTSSTIGWLNFVDLTAKSHLVWPGHQFSFRDVNSMAIGRITRFILQQPVSSLKIWDITDPAGISEMELSINSDSAVFIRPSDSLHEFYAFDQTDYFRAGFSGEIKNQNLHSHAAANLVIVTAGIFLEQAERLADYHRNKSQLTVQIADINDIYNEFSCGQPNPCAIRDYVRMLWLRGNDQTRPKYLLLIGDGSYDPKNRVPGNNNLIPTYQSTESLTTTSSYLTDDFFGIFSPSGGQDANGTIDIGIGRFAVSTAAEAKIMVDKILGYSSLSYPVRSEWRNTLTFVADDENRNLHMEQAEDLATIVKTKYPVFNVNKIYFDAYKMVEIPGGQRFPDATVALNHAVDKGSLIVNYTGHGGETGWSYEQVLTTADILSWKNAGKLPVFVTATCEFSRFDNPERYTAGEMLINQEGGGAIALFSTTRLAYAGDNTLLNQSFFAHLMDKDLNGNYIKMGDLIRLSKNENKNKNQLKNFVLLGDPAQSLAFPELKVYTKHINSGNGELPDTVTGLSMVTVNGEIEDQLGNKLFDFNGNIDCKIFDKPVTYITLGNRPNGETFPAPFTMQNNLLFHGKVPVTAGEFYVHFPVPKSISLQFGRGKISYYAVDSTREANGYNDNLIIGGADPEINPVNPGPQINMFINSREFLNGDQVPATSTFIADLADTNGINALDLGIGHELLLTLDNDLPHATVINDWFTPLFNSFSRGTVEFPMPEISAGTHTLALKAWDLFDNSSVATISFTVPGIPGPSMTGVITAPNPMTGTTRFLFTPNTAFSGNFNTTIQIYDIRGNLVSTLKQALVYPLKETRSITWDGSDCSGKPLKSGLYPYRILFSDENGAYYETTQKLMIIR